MQVLVLNVSSPPSLLPEQSQIFNCRSHSTALTAQNSPTFVKFLSNYARNATGVVRDAHEIQSTPAAAELVSGHVAPV